ncbi:hypothetical protein GOB17_26900 [Sinorhizobium meliloti]|uniref:hypothetical protein n=1 Tax=Rhizobium meliloti TaxID=382 RepID=UPI00299D1B65|nr:hypothetical protein [Sinorhizobium meliloti]MDX0185374.1 hypothetical protein [Sinorhizobium meliloti]
MQALATVTVFVTFPPVLADDPTWEIENIINAPIATFTVYPIRIDSFVDFLNTAVSTGPYNLKLRGFANERIVEPLPESGREVANVLIFTRYYDDGTAAKVHAARDAALREFTQAPSTRFTAKLVSTTFGNWNWELGGREPFAQKSFSVANMDDVLREPAEVAVSFGKAGYVGQAAMVEFFDGSTPVSALRESFAKREALQGASIYEAEAGGTYIVYSEYFQLDQESARSTISFTAAERDKRPEVAGSQFGIVASNYQGR